jgi:catechol 2,3-dioxygenase-like lactoylglutathione lyase family enzyme
LAVSEKPEPHPSNPFATRAYVFTVVTPDMDASIHFYRDVMGNKILEQGALGGRAPTVPGAGVTGRRYTLLNHIEEGIVDRGVIRLLEAPPGAEANRPRPDTHFYEPGLAVIECHCADFDASHRHLTKNGVKTVSPPQYYFTGDPAAPVTSTTSYSAFGPAGEQMLISCQNVPNVFKQKRPVTFPGFFGPITAHSMMCFSRWPVWAFYETVFGFTNQMDRAIEKEPINTLCGLPPKTYFLHSMPGKDMRMEVWDFYQFGPPPAVPPHPTQLDKTGVAMVTMLVDNLAAVRKRVDMAGIPVLGEGALPTPGQPYRDGFYIRGAVGELLEIVGRS